MITPLDFLAARKIVIGGVAGISKTFDRCVVINLDRRRERFDKVLEHFKERDWPFIQPIRMRAIDGQRVPVPTHWCAGSGAWGCMSSHRRVLEDAIMDGCRSVLVMEDDIVLVDGFAEKVAAFLKHVPKDWGQLMLGGQGVNRDGALSQEIVAEGVARVTGVERTHCYAVRGEYMRALYSKWSSASGHCDHVMGPFQRAAGIPVYAPTTFLAGQGEGVSDICGREQDERFWDIGAKPIAWFSKRPGGTHYHGGYSLVKDLDEGLTRILEADSEPEEKARQVRNWMGMICWEAASCTPEKRPAIWHPLLTPELMRATGQLFEDKRAKPCGSCGKGTQRTTGRVGTELKRLLALFGIKPEAGCPCEKRAMIMDAKGIEWCRAHEDRIVQWLREEAERRNLPFFDTIGHRLVRRAIRNVEKI